MKSDTVVVEAGLVAHNLYDCNIRTQEYEAGGLLQETNLEYVRKTCLKKQFKKLKCT